MRLRLRRTTPERYPTGMVTSSNGSAPTPAPAAAPSTAPSGTYTPTLSTHEYAVAVSALGIRKANSRPWQQLLLGVLAGFYIGLGGHVFLVAMQQGMGRVVGGFVFSSGLVMVLIAGAELFTGNIILIVSALTGVISVRRMLRNWGAVYVGNFLGAYGLALLVGAAGLLGRPDAPSAVGALAAKVAEAKQAIPFGQAFVLGVLCNICVLLAIIMATLARDVVSKVVCIAIPIMIFVACGFEHCIANMYLIPVGLVAKGVPGGWNWAMWGNFVPVTLGNIVGGVAILLLHPNRLRQLGHLLQARRHHKAV
jgi:formate/nitrite transporter